MMIMTCWIFFGPASGWIAVWPGCRSTAGTPGDEATPPLQAHRSNAVAAIASENFLSNMLVVIRRPRIERLVHKIVGVILSLDWRERTRRLIEVKGIVGRR